MKYRLISTHSLMRNKTRRYCCHEKASRRMCGTSGWLFDGRNGLIFAGNPTWHSSHLCQLSMAEYGQINEMNVTHVKQTAKVRRRSCRSKVERWEFSFNVFLPVAWGDAARADGLTTDMPGTHAKIIAQKNNRLFFLDVFCTNFVWPTKKPSQIPSVASFSDLSLERLLD